MNRIILDDIYGNKFDFKLKGAKTIVSGKSASGKSFIYNLIKKISMTLPAMSEPMIQANTSLPIWQVKCMLLLAEEEEDFDYDAFFRAYASLWKGIYSREYCEQSAYQDSHPIDYLRVNVTLMQQPEFYETYDIKEGDGMYMAEEDRIAVW